MSPRASQLALAAPAVVSEVVLEHLPSALAPDGGAAAPRAFAVSGYAEALDGVAYDLGAFSYDLEGPPAQAFAAAPSPKPGSFLKLDIASNHGSDDFTCVYRLRVY